MRQPSECSGRGAVPAGAFRLQERGKTRKRLPGERAGRFTFQKFSIGSEAEGF
jgi:hypothetical protein